MNQPIPNWLQWLALLATFAGMILALWAALSATGARRQAQLAREAAVRLGRIAQVHDLLESLMELQIMIVRGDLAAIAAKAGHLKGQIVRFEAEAYNDLEVHDRECLVIAREQVGLIVEQATAGRASPETKGRRIQAAHALAEEQLNRILGNRRAEIRRERLWPST